MNEIICGCMQVTKQDVIDAINNGAKSFEEIKEQTKLGGGCTGCLTANQELVEALLSN